MDVNTQSGSQPTEQQLVVHNVFLKDASLEAPNSPQIFQHPWQPKIDFDLNIASRKLDKDIYEVVVNVTVTTRLLDEAQKQAENKKDENTKTAAKGKQEETKLATGADAEPQGMVAFLVEIKQGGVFTITGFEAEKLEQILATIVPNIIFPYARESISSLVVKAGFPQLILPPVNFDAMYREYLKQQEDKKKEASKH